MEDQWLAWVKRMHAIASTGLHFGAHDFDRERYEEMAAIADAMLARLTQQPVADIASLFGDFGKGYATPKVDVRGAVIRDNAMLLVQERADELWTLPGGYADVGLSAAENVVKEIREEAGLVVEAKRVIAVRHKAKHAYRADVRDFYKVLFPCEATDAAEPEPGLETLDASFVARDHIPPLSTPRTIELDIQQAWAHYDDPALAVAFD